MISNHSMSLNYKMSKLTVLQYNVYFWIFVYPYMCIFEINVLLLNQSEK